MTSRRVRTLLLLIILGIPVLLYLFLQGFGDNQYQVPVLHKQGFAVLQEGCEDMPAPQAIDQFIHQGPCQRWHCDYLHGKLVLFNFQLSGCGPDYLSEVARVCNQYHSSSKFMAVTIGMDSLTRDTEVVRQISQYTIDNKRWLWWSFDEVVFDLAACGFNLELDCSLAAKSVLIDSMNRIRGYYDLADPQELDRLNTEIAILNQENQQ